MQFSAQNDHFSVPSEKAISGAKTMRGTDGTVRQLFFMRPTFPLPAQVADYQLLKIII